jgi:hypothetical protein
MAGVVGRETTELVETHSQEASDLLGRVEEMGRLVALASERLGREIGHGEMTGEVVQDHALDLSSEAMCAYFTLLLVELDGFGRVTPG